MKGNRVVAKQLFLCMNFPYYCNTIYLTSIGC